MRTLSNLIAKWGGPALMLGALIFSLTKARGYVDPDDSLLVYFMAVGFAAWLVGLGALFARYAPPSGRLGKIGLGVSFVGMAAMAVGHLFSFSPVYYVIEGYFVLEVAMFSLFVLGVLGLMAGLLLFGIATLRAEVLPHRWRFVPFATAMIGLVWITVTGSDDGSLTFGFMFFRTLFAFGWFLMGFVLWFDGEEAAQPSTGGASTYPARTTQSRSGSYVHLRTRKFWR